MQASDPKSLAGLMSLSRDALALRWAQEFGCPAPQRAHAQLLLSALAWRYQMVQAGEAEVRQVVRRLTRQATSPASSVTLSPGTRLLREWHGITHHVTVVSDGFEYAGKRYNSLTAIARNITGTAWSGPAFFGVRQ